MHYVISAINRIITILHELFLKIIYRKKIKFSKWGGVIFPSTHFVIQDKGSILIGEGIGIRRRCEFNVSEEGILEIGNNVFFNNSCMVVAHDKITIGSGTRFGPSVIIYDHDYDYKNRDSFIRGKHLSSPISIGKNCWIGAGTIILRGTIIGDDCVIGAGCVLKGKYPEKAVIVQNNNKIVRKYD